MRIPPRILVSHTIVAVVAIVLSIYMGDADQTTRWTIVGATVALTVLIASVLQGRRQRRGMMLLDRVVRGEQVAAEELSGVGEFDRLVKQWTETSSSKEEIEADLGRFNREIGVILQRLDISSSSQQLSSTQLRHALGRIGTDMHTLMGQVQHCLAQLGDCSRGIVASSAGATSAAANTGSCLAELSGSVETTRSESGNIEEKIASIDHSIVDTVRLTTELNDRFAQIQHASDYQLRQLRSLCDPTRQIECIAEGIADVAKRTNMLALNASIEAIRNGEDGAGFAAVADDIRRLSDTIAKSACEVGEVTETLLAQANESIDFVSDERSKTSEDVDLLGTLESQLADAIAIAAEVKDCNRTLAAEASQQQRLIQAISSTIEQQNTDAKSDRQCVDQLVGTMKSIGSTATQLDSLIRPLRQCAENSDGGERLDFQAAIEMPSDHQHEDHANGIIGETSSSSDSSELAGV